MIFKTVSTKQNKKKEIKSDVTTCFKLPLFVFHFFLNPFLYLLLHIELLLSQHIICFQERGYVIPFGC